MALTTNSKVVFNSPIYLIDVILEVVRERFTKTTADGPNLVTGWQWIDDPKKTQIFIESGLAEDREEFNTRPSIFVNRLNTVPDENVIGNSATQDPKTSLKVYYCSESSSFQIDCIAKKQGECVTIADVVYKHLLAAKNLIRREFSLRKFTNPVLGTTRPMQRDTSLFVTPITFVIEADVVWATYEIGPLLAKFRATLTEQGVIHIFNESTVPASRPRLGSGNDLSQK